MGRNGSSHGETSTAKAPTFFTNLGRERSNSTNLRETLQKSNGAAVNAPRTWRDERVLQTPMRASRDPAIAPWLALRWVREYFFEGEPWLSNLSTCRLPFTSACSVEPNNEFCKRSSRQSRKVAVDVSLP